jgi:N-dimethylarginine dimethylaminohydrolase
MRDGLALQVDIERLRDEQENLAEKLEESGVKVYWIEYPEKPMAAFGPMTNQHSASELLVVPGGSIIPKKGYALAPLSGFGRTEYLARWAFWNLGIPPLLTIVGKGVWIAGVFLAEDVYVQTMSVETNAEGLEQVIPVLKKVCGEDLRIRTIQTPGAAYFDRKSGYNAHTDMIIAPLDVDKLLVFPGGIDTSTHIWLRKAGYKTIEVDVEEQIKDCPCNLIPLEPGRVIMHAGAERAIAAVRKAGVEVIPVPYTEYNKFGGGIHCATMQILRDPGPRHFHN